MIKFVSHTPFQRSISAFRNYATKCPEPTYDTGCTYCQIPEDIKSTLKSPPESIRNTMPPLNKILIYLSNNKDYNSWPKKVEAYDIMKNLSSIGRGNGNMICYSSLSPRKSSSIEEEAEFLLFPDAKKVYIDLKSNTENVHFKHLFQKLNSGSSLEPTESIALSPVTKTTVLICGHAQRDIRCGVVGKLVHDEFEKVMQHEGITDEIDLGYISHVGGHVYAGNVVIMKPDGTVFWYGMVRPENVQGIVEMSIKDNQVIEELSRQ